METQVIVSAAEKQRSEMASTLMELIRNPAIAPENGGDGESLKAETLARILENIGFDKIERYDAEDQRVTSKKRPNIIAYHYGENPSERLWIVTHMDIVPAGEESLWTETKPFEPIIKDGKVFGRGSEDNGQALISSIFSLKTLRNMGVKAKRTVALAFVADEEQGSDYGIKHLIKQNLFHKDDLVVVPDGGNEDGSFIEIAEKTVLWLEITTVGRQTHASRPETGLNAHRVGLQYADALDKLLHEKYSVRDELFEPPESTFEPTKKSKNVDAVNIIPGEDVFCFDCRILPQYDSELIFADFRNLADQFEEKTKARIQIRKLQETTAPKETFRDARINTLLEQAIQKTRNVIPKIGGIGGGTCAAYFRKAGIPAVVWSTSDEMAHQPNEYARIDNLVNDSIVFTLLAVS
jgi:succinyl-diaminopimelate desuccinylase